MSERIKNGGALLAPAVHGLPVLARSATSATQPDSVDDDNSMTARRYRSCNRYNGRCSAYLLAIRSAKKPGPGIPLSIGRGGSDPTIRSR